MKCIIDIETDNIDPLKVEKKEIVEMVP